jgi:ribosome-binding protein aMBF1 (putative translation factor)
MAMTVQQQTEEVSRVILRHLRKNAGRCVAWKEMANIASVRPEKVKDAITQLTSVDCLPIRVNGDGCVYENSKVRRNAKAKDEEATVAVVAKKTMDLNSELARMRESLLEMATSVESLERAIGQGKVALPKSRDASAEGTALRVLREERGVARSTLAQWLSKTEHYVAELEDGKRLMSESEGREFVKELRMDSGVFNSRLGQGQPVFPWLVD